MTKVKFTIQRMEQTRGLLVGDLVQPPFCILLRWQLLSLVCVRVVFFTMVNGVPLMKLGLDLSSIFV